MDYAVVGGDARFAYLTRLLCSRGLDARRIGGRDDVPNVAAAEMSELAKAKNIVVNCPPPEGVLENIAAEARLWFCGPGAPENVGHRFVNLWKDEKLQLENAWLTAEGALCAAMNAQKRSLKDCHCLVVGWGRIGRALTELLIGMNAQVTVASRSERGRNGAAERGAESVSTYELAQALPEKQIVFSTPPVRLLGERELQHADRDALILDLASPPYGVDLDAARALNLRAWREPGLPGRHCPYSAALALLRAIDREERKDRYAQA